MALKIKEKQIEDFICENLEESFAWMDPILMGRQMRVPHGILDLLVWTGRVTAIIEIKAVALQEKDIGQVLRYTHDIRTFLQHAQMDLLCKHHSPREARTRVDDLYVDRYLAYCGVKPDNEMLIQPILVGKSGSETVITAAQGANIETYQWKLDESNGKFEFDQLHAWLFAAKYKIPFWAEYISELSDIRAKEWADWQFRSEIGRLFESIPNFGGISE